MLAMTALLLCCTCSAQSRHQAVARACVAVGICTAPGNPAYLQVAVVTDQCQQCPKTEYKRPFRCTSIRFSVGVSIYQSKCTAAPYYRAAHLTLSCCPFLLEPRLPFKGLSCHLIHHLSLTRELGCCSSVSGPQGSALAWPGPG
jgi:hypothetical protein